MGSGRWDATTYAGNTAAKRASGTPDFAYSKHTTSSLPRSAWKAHDDLNPKGVKVRESRDSDEHPTSLAIAVLFDVTGSMGSIPQTLQQKLPELYGLILRKGYGATRLLEPGAHPRDRSDEALGIVSEEAEAQVAKMAENAADALRAPDGPVGAAGMVVVERPALAARLAGSADAAAVLLPGELLVEPCGTQSRSAQPADQLAAPATFGIGTPALGHVPGLPAPALLAVSRLARRAHGRPEPVALVDEGGPAVPAAIGLLHGAIGISLAVSVGVPPGSALVRSLQPTTPGGRLAGLARRWTSQRLRSLHDILTARVRTSGFHRPTFPSSP